MDTKFVYFTNGKL